MDINGLQLSPCEHLHVHSEKVGELATANQRSQWKKWCGNENKPDQADHVDPTI